MYLLLIIFINSLKYVLTLNMNETSLDLWSEPHPPNIMVSEFLVDILQKETTINSDYYCAILDRLKAEIAEKRPHLQIKQVGKF